jgi:hypothetical protein
MSDARRTRPTRCAAFPLCFLAALLLTLAALFGSVAVSAARTDLFKDGLHRYVVAAGVMSRADADAFAEETIGYLTGARNTWAPSATVDGEPLAVPETFAAHMATVRTGLLFAKTALPLAAAAGFLLLTACSLASGRRGRGSVLSVAGYCCGAAFPALVALGLGLWGALDFNAFWAWLHTAFIPDGIFPAGEAILRLFPQALFAGYAAPVGVTFAVYWATVLLLPWGMKRLTGKLGGKAVG